MEVRIPEIEEIMEKLKTIESAIEEIKRMIKPDQVWYDLKSACSLKGLNYNTVISNPRYQPNFGIPDAVICGRKRWRRETILKWLEATDDCLEEALKRHLKNNKERRIKSSA